MTNLRSKPNCYDEIGAKIEDKLLNNLDKGDIDGRMIQLLTLDKHEYNVSFKNERVSFPPPVISI